MAIAFVHQNLRDAGAATASPWPKSPHQEALPEAMELPGAGLETKRSHDLPSSTRDQLEHGRETARSSESPTATDCANM
jgi:hypothetical protein